MCVIMLVENKDCRPTELMVEKAYDRNEDGGGVAYRAPSKDGKDVEVVWEKGLNYKDMQDRIRILPVPFVAHFRLASVAGGGIWPQLTHPFPVDDHSSLALKGRTKGYVFFHNGNWKEWTEAARGAAIQSGIKIPGGRWSDSRAIAWLMSIYGNGFMGFLPDQRGIAFGPKDYDVFSGPGWIPINGIWHSNDLHMHHVGNGAMCRYGSCKERHRPSHPHDADSRCEAHPLAEFPNTYPHSVSSSSGASGVAHGTPAPFQQKSAGPIISLELATKWEDQGRISKQLLKAIRRLHYKIREKGKGSMKATETLQVITRNLMNSHR